MLSFFTYFRLLRIAYGLIGVFEAIGGFYVAFIILAQNGFLINDMIGVRKDWDNKGLNDYTDSYGQQWVRIGHCQNHVLCLTFYFRFFPWKLLYSKPLS